MRDEHVVADINTDAEEVLFVLWSSLAKTVAAVTGTVTDGDGPAARKRRRVSKDGAALSDKPQKQKTKPSPLQTLRAILKNAQQLTVDDERTDRNHQIVFD